MGKKINTKNPTSRFLRACYGLDVDATPIWLMRQAGRYMQEYRKIRSKRSMLDVIFTPELAAEVTLQPIKAFDMDAAIIFADILPPLMGMGLKLEFVKGKGPVIYNPIQTKVDIHNLEIPKAKEVLASTLAAIQLVVTELDKQDIPLIGFAGAPFTLASYAIEGGSSKNFSKTKALMYSEPAAWQQLMQKLVAVQAEYLLEQAEAGASALQIFDSWVGLALSKSDYLRFVKPFNRQLISKLEKANVPVISFSNGSFAFIDDVADCGGNVIGVDWRMPIGEYWDKIGNDQSIMGNLDPVALLAPTDELYSQIDQVLVAAGGRLGHIFNLGHGILPDVPVENAIHFVSECQRVSKK